MQTLVATIAFAAVFLFGHHLQAHRRRWRRAGVSAGAGAAVAYLFVHLLPAMEEASKGFVRTSVMRRPWSAESHVYLAALVGFILFYGLEHLVSWSHRTAPPGETVSEGGNAVFLLHTGGFAVYAAMVSYLMVREADTTEASILLFATAMGLHFLSLNHSLLHRHGDRYVRSGRYVLAAAVLAGWGSGTMIGIPTSVVCVLIGLVSGGVIMNSMIAELPREGEGKFLPFVSGAGAYAAIVLLATG